MREASINSAGLTKSDQRVLRSLQEIITQIGPSDPQRAVKASIVLQALRDNPSWLNTKLGRDVARGALPMIKRSTSEEIVYPKSNLQSECDFELREFRKAYAKNYPDDENGPYGKI